MIKRERLEEFKRFLETASAHPEILLRELPFNIDILLKKYSRILIRCRKNGMNTKEIADLLFEQTGVTVSPQKIARYAPRTAFMKRTTRKKSVERNPQNI